METQDISYACIHTDKQGASSSDTADVDSEGKGIEPRPWHRAFWLVLLVVFSSPPGQTSRYRSLVQFCHPTTWCYKL